MFVQEQWLCFEPILSTADIASKMETEGRLFKVRQEHKNTIYLFINANFIPFSNIIRINCIKCATNDFNGSETNKKIMSTHYLCEQVQHAIIDS